MFQFERVYERAADNYGLITTEAAAELNVHRKELLYWTKIGRLERCGRGVYRINHYIPTDYDKYAEAVALVGGRAALYGETVLAMHNLALVNPPAITVATEKRLRKTLPRWIQVVKMPADMREDDFNGIPCQNFVDAIRTCKGEVMNDRLLDAVHEGLRKGLLVEKEATELEKELAR